MSYDVSLMIGEVEVKDCGNYTRNVNHMLHEALGVPFISLDSRIAREAIPILEKAIERMESEPSKYEAMNSSNGWGKHDGAVEFLKNILNDCRLLPDTIISIT